MQEELFSIINSTPDPGLAGIFFALSLTVGKHPTDFLQSFSPVALRFIGKFFPNSIEDECFHLFCSAKNERDCLMKQLIFSILSRYP